MSRLMVLVVREFRENFRQTWLLVTLASTMGVLALVCLVLLGFAEDILHQPVTSKDLTFWADTLGLQLDDPGADLAGVVVFSLQSFALVLLLSFTGVMAGHAGIHDRQCGTLPFLLLAPIRRFELLTGKVVGALSVPLLVYLVIGGGSSLWASTYEVAATQSGFLPPSGGWLAGFLVSGPVWSLFIATLCVLVSTLARDVRTAQQAAWAIVFFATFVLGPLLVSMMPMGATVQLVLASAGAVLTLCALSAGSWMIGRDLTR